MPIDPKLIDDDDPGDVDPEDLEEDDQEDDGGDPDDDEPELEECRAAGRKRAREMIAGRCEDHGYPLSLCPYGCSGLA